LLLLPAGVVGATDLVAGLLPMNRHILRSAAVPKTEP